jgi:outer membrane receptor protein involved in Fe transport
MPSRNCRIATLARTAAAIFLVIAAAAPPLRGQDGGRIVGRVIDASSGAGLSDVGVQVVGTTLGTQSGVDGRFQIPNVPAGTVTIQARRIGYAPKSVTGIVLQAGQTLEQNVSLETAAVTLTAQVVTAAAERGSVANALDQQRTATGIVSSVTSEQIARSPDSDAAQAVQRVSGVTVQDGRYVVVRGLGERYTTASLNGARLPSPEPERRVVPLDLFPSALLQSVTTSKTFTPDQTGDFSGAQVDIQTREFPAERVMSYSASVGYNAAATGQTVVGAPTIGQEWLGFAGSERQRPASLADPRAFNSATQPQINGVINSFRNAWTAPSVTGTPNYSLSGTVGGNDPVLGRRIGYIGSLTYSNTQEVRADEERGLAIPSTSGEGTQYTSRFRGSTGRTSVLWGGLLNLSTVIGNNRFAFNNTYNRTSDNEGRTDFGFDENIGFNLQRTTLRFVERSVLSSQLRGDHAFGGRAAFDWSLNASRVSRNEPDRSDLVYIEGQSGDLSLFSQGFEGARRTFGELGENSLSGGANFRLDYGDPSRQSYVKVGGLVRNTERDALNQSYSITGNLPVAEAALPAEQIFDGRYTTDQSSVFRIIPLAFGGSYDASELIGGYYGMTQYGLTDRLRVIGGARVEHWRLRIDVERTTGDRLRVPRDNTDILPSLAVNYALGETQNVRLSASQTLSRPEYREFAPITYLDIIGGEAVRGEPALERTLIQNADLRWEWYPNPGEILSVAAFAKYFDQPIERVQIGTSGTSLVSFANAESARNYGLEFEARKGLGGITEILQPITLFSNVTLMNSDIELDQRRVNVENANRPMVGQAPYVVNAGFTYASETGRASATVLYNVVGKRIYSASTQGLPDVYEFPRNVLDISLRVPVGSALAARLDARNLLDAPFRLEQGQVTRERYRVGRVFSVGLSWQP